MRDFRDAKAMARSLRQGLSHHGLTLTQSQTLELTAQVFGFDNWNILAARITAARPTEADRSQTYYCSFCGKAQQEVQTLVAGPNVAICDACVGLCSDIIEHNVVLQLMRDDAASGGGDHPALRAYLGARTRLQIGAYLAGTTERLRALPPRSAGRRLAGGDGYMTLSETALAAVSAILAERGDD